MYAIRSYYVQHPCLNRYETIQDSGRYSTCQVDRVQVADDEIARDFGDDDPGLSIFGHELLLLNHGW